MEIYRRRLPDLSRAVFNFVACTIQLINAFDLFEIALYSRAAGRLEHLTGEMGNVT
jgi:hypothetical protein